MKSHPKLLSALVVVCAAAAGVPLFGAAELKLSDGQVLRGADVRRDGDVYILILDNGSAVSLPSDLVVSVRLEEDAKPAPTGIVVANEGTQLSGAEVAPPRTDQQLKVLGKPSEFAPGPVDPTWHPEPAFNPNQDVLADSRSTWAQGPVDPDWTPESAFDGRDDVMADSRSSFSQGVVDSAWQPTDGFQRKNLSFVLARNARIAAEIGAASAWSCGETLMAQGGAVRAEKLRVARIADDRFQAVPIPLFRADGELAGEPRRAVFTTAGGTCEPLFLNDSGAARATAAFNAAVGRETATTGAKPGDPVAYALAVISLLDPELASGSESRIEILDDPADVATLGSAKESGCKAGGRARRRAVKEAERRIAAPTVVGDDLGRVVTLYAWSPSGGEVAKHVVTVGHDGAVSVSSEPVAAHVGRHDERARTASPD